MEKNVSICVIGAGAVGATCAYSLLMRNVASEITLYDVLEKKCEGEVLDLTDALFSSSTSCVRKVSAKEAGQADIIVITAGAAQKPGETRVQLLSKNIGILNSVFASVKPINRNAIIILVANPVDVLTYYAQLKSGLPREQVFGSGTFLDSQRLRLQVSQKLNVCVPAVHAYILGEHGDSQFVAWSSASVGCTPLVQFPEFSSESTRRELALNAMRKAYDIIEAKGATLYGIGSCVASLCESIAFDRRDIRPVSIYNESYDVCFSQPCVIGRKGIERIIPCPLNAEENEKLMNSVKAIKEAVESVRDKAG